MISLHTTADTVVMLIIAAIVGAIAGIGAYALQSRAAADQDTRLGVIASMLVGGLASLGVLYFFSPVTNTTITAANGKTTMSSHYDLVKLVALAVIVGSGGRAFLIALQARASALLSQQTSANVLTQLPKALDEAKSNIADDTANVAATINEHAQTLTDLAAAPNAPQPVIEAAEALSAAQGALTTVAEHAQAHLDEAQSRVEAAAAPALLHPPPPAGSTETDPVTPVRTEADGNAGNAGNPGNAGNGAQE